MIRGFYRVISDGSVVYEGENTITSNGLLAINQFLAGSIPSWAGSISVGALAKNATASGTTQMDYEINRYPITLKSYRTVSSSVNQIAVKASMDAGSSFTVYELGVFPMVVDNRTYTDNFPITDFSERNGASSAWLYQNGASAVTASASPSARVGTYTVVVPTGSTAYTPITMDVSSYGNADSIDVLFYTTASLASGSFTFSLADNSASANVWTASGTLSASVAASAYASASLAFQPKPAAFNNSLASASVRWNGSGSVYFDHAKFSTGEAKPVDDKLVSRISASSGIFTKAYGQPIEIEYYIQVT